MSWTIRRVCLPLMAVAAIVVLPGTALAIPLTFNGTQTNTAPPFHAPAPTDVSVFTGDFNLAPGSQITVAADIDFSFRTSVALGSLTIDGDLNVPSQTQSISLLGGGLKINNPVTGSAELTLWDQQTGGFDPGGDGSNPSPATFPPSVLTGADLTNLNVTLVQPGGPTATSNTLTINGSGGIPISLFGLDLGSIPVDAQLNGSATAGINSLGYTQTSGDGLSGPGSPGTPLNQTSSYGMNFGNWGTLNGGLNANIGGNLDVDILGLNVGSFNINLPQTFNISESTPLPGLATLADLQPTSYDVVNYDDLQATFGLLPGGSGILNIDFPLSTSGTAALTTVTTITTTLAGVGVTITANVTGTVTFGIVATLQASNLGYQLQDSVAGVVAPEPGSIVLLFLGLASAAPLMLRRFRKR